MSTNHSLHVAVALDPSGLLHGSELLERVDDAVASGATMVLLEDSHRRTSGHDRLDALMSAAWLGPRTAKVGIVPVVVTTVTEPFLLASQVATLDFITHGRAGWLAQVSDSPADQGYVGPRPVATGHEAWVEAAEYVEVVRRLWDSWEDGAEIRDSAGGRFFDPKRVHYVDFHGEYLAVKGPSITPRPPQGQPPIVARVVSGPARGPGLQLAAAQADVIVISPEVTLDEVNAALADAGRERTEVRVFADASEVSDAELPKLVRTGIDGVQFPVAGGHGGLADLHERVAELRRGGHEINAWSGSTLREALGLTRPVNRYAAASARQEAA